LSGPFSSLRAIPPRGGSLGPTQADLACAGPRWDIVTVWRIENRAHGAPNAATLAAFGPGRGRIGARRALGAEGPMRHFLNAAVARLDNRAATRPIGSNK